MATLKDWLPSDVTFDEIDAVTRHLNTEVVAEVAGLWVGKHRNVHTWCVLATGHCVGWNENPSHGWSFPVVAKTMEEAMAAVEASDQQIMRHYPYVRREIVDGKRVFWNVDTPDKKSTSPLSATI